MSKETIFDVLLVLKVIGGASCGKLVIIPDCLCTIGEVIRISRDDNRVMWYNDFFDFGRDYDRYVIDWREKDEHYLRHEGIKLN